MLYEVITHLHNSRVKVIMQGWTFHLASGSTEIPILRICPIHSTKSHHGSVVPTKFQTVGHSILVQEFTSSCPHTPLWDIVITSYSIHYTKLYENIIFLNALKYTVAEYIFMMYICQPWVCNLDLMQRDVRKKQLGYSNAY